MHITPGSSSWKSLTLENYPREVRIKMGARCDLHQPPGVTDVSVFEGRLICTHGRGVWEFPGAPPFLAGFSGTILGVERIEPSTLIKNRC